MKNVNGDGNTSIPEKVFRNIEARKRQAVPSLLASTKKLFFYHAIKEKLESRLSILAHNIVTVLMLLFSTGFF